MIAARLRAYAHALRANAERDATTLDALADEIERGDDALVRDEVAAAALGIPVRQLREDLTRRGETIEKVGAAVFIRRGSITRKVAPIAKAKNTNAQPRAEVTRDDRANARAAVQRAAARAAR
jgi:hypothetical protein